MDPTERTGSNGQPPNPGRLPNGHFAVGNKHGPGNPNALRQYELRKAILESSSPEKVKAVAHKLLKLAIEKDDVAACKLYLEYTVGRPAQAVEISGPDGTALAPDLVRLRVAILGALDGDPAARFKVARALLAIDGGIAGGDGGGGGDGDEPAGDAGD